MYEVARDQNDIATHAFLQWFITEQVEEEKNATQSLDMLQKINSSVGSLYQLDPRLGKRGGEED